MAVTAGTNVVGVAFTAGTHVVGVAVTAVLM